VVAFEATGHQHECLDQKDGIRCLIIRLLSSVSLVPYRIYVERLTEEIISHHRAVWGQQGRLQHLCGKLICSRFIGARSLCGANRAVRSQQESTLARALSVTTSIPELDKAT
jgi:hypothetical protein